MNNDGYFKSKKFEDRYCPEKAFELQTKSNNGMNKIHPRVSEFEFNSFFSMITCPRCKENQIIEDCNANSTKDVECCFCKNKFTFKFGNYQRLEDVDENYRRELKRSSYNNY